MSKEKTIDVFKTELEKIQFFKKIYFEIKKELEERSKLIRSLQILGKQYLKEPNFETYFYDYIKPKKQFADYDLAQSRLKDLYDYENEDKEKRKEIAQKISKKFFNEFEKLIQINNKIFLNYEKIKNYNSLILKIIKFNPINIKEDKNEVEKYDYSEISQIPFERIIHRLNSFKYLDFFIKFENEIEKIERQLEDRNFKERQIKFNQILSIGVMGALIYYIYEMIDKHFFINNFKSYLGIAILILVLTILFLITMTLNSLNNKILPKILIWIVAIIAIIFGLMYIFCENFQIEITQDQANSNVSEINQNTEKINETQTILNQTQNELNSLKECIKNKLKLNESFEICLN